MEICTRRMGVPIREMHIGGRRAAHLHARERAPDERRPRGRRRRRGRLARNTDRLCHRGA